MANILILYGAKSYPLRATTQDHLYCFRRYSGHRCFYFNTLALSKPWYRKPPRFLQRERFDLIIFYLDLINIQWPPYSLDAYIRQAEFFKEMKSVKVALAQDEFYHTDQLDRFICEFGVDHVFSLAAPSEWRKIYPSVDPGRVQFHRALPGYLDERRLRRITHLAKAGTDRPIDIGYRAVRSQNAAWLGSHGNLKLEIAGLFQSHAGGFGIKTDISTSAKDVLLGNDWYDFLMRSKYTIAVEGGASILDADGSVRLKTEAYSKEHPEAEFEEIEQACFPGRDGELNYKAISPKHLESCATRTCQILMEGEYNGILTPGVHYIELKRDFSNLDEILENVRSDHLRAQMTERAYRDIVESGAYTYRGFVRWVLELTLPNPSTSHADSFKATAVYVQGRIYETCQWLALAILSALLRIIRRFLPSGIESLLRRIFT